MGYLDDNVRKMQLLYSMRLFSIWNDCENSKIRSLHLSSKLFSVIAHLASTLLILEQIPITFLISASPLHQPFSKSPKFSYCQCKRHRQS